MRTCKLFKIRPHTMKGTRARLSHKAFNVTMNSSLFLDRSEWGCSRVEMKDLLSSKYKVRTHTHSVYPWKLRWVTGRLCLFGDCPLVLRPIGPTTHWSYGPWFLRPIGPTAHWSYGPLVLQLIGNMARK